MAPVAVFAITFVVSFLAACAVVVTKNHHGAFTFDGDDGVQKIHDNPTPRIGGVAMLLGAIAAGLAMTEGASALWWTIWLCGMPAFLSGALEDLTKRVGVKWRLLATVLSGVIFCVVTGAHIDHADLPGMDMLLQHAWIAIPVTALLIGGIANALNIVDGVNGLASGTTIIILSGFAVLASQAGDAELVAICVAMIGTVAGFFVLNFPYGRLFLGDAGAYSSGFILAVIGILLPLRNPEFSPLIGILALSYPIIETLVSIYRRARRKGTNPGVADRLHLHSLLYRYRAKRIAEMIGRPDLRNPITAIVLWGLSIAAMVSVVLFARDPGLLLLALAAVFSFYILLYRRVALLRPTSKTWRRAHRITPGE